MKSAFTGLLLLSLLCSAFAFHWKECGEGQTHITSVSLQPDPPVAGSPADFGIKGESGVEVDEGTMSLAVAFMGFPIWSQTFDLCDRTSCPVKKGPVELAVQEYLPPITPPGAYNVTITAQNTANVQLLCLQIDFEIKPPTPPTDIESEASAAQVQEVSAARQRQVVVS
ncbi:hypothetical protein WJX74_006299 [Apatococcus lobatus]|uniref:MD-2-related lipid-recognition domain-containing protein n=1 Tax=Apatococcus lobatus TaxID=904363 RepID=A0AAW1R1L5_9CHLO